MSEVVNPLAPDGSELMACEGCGHLASDGEAYLDYKGVCPECGSLNAWVLSIHYQKA